MHGQGHLSSDEVVQCPIQPDLEHFRDGASAASLDNLRVLRQFQGLSSVSKSIIPYIQSTSTSFQFKAIACQGACQSLSGWHPFPRMYPTAPLSLVPSTDLRMHSISLSMPLVKISNSIGHSTDPWGKVLSNLRKKNRAYKNLFKIKRIKLNIISYCHLFWGKYADFFFFNGILPYFLALVPFISLQKTSVIPVIIDVLF